MIAGEVLDAMLAAGCTAEQIVAAVKADVARDEQALIVKRAKDAARQRKSRTIRLSSHDVTVTPGTAISGEDDSIKGFTPITPKGVTAPKGAKRDRGSKIGEDWAPPPIAELGPEFRPLAEQWTADSYRTEAAAFRSYWLGETGAKANKANWKRAWENRIAQIHGKVMRDQRFAQPTAPANDFLAHLVAKQSR